MIYNDVEMGECKDCDMGVDGSIFDEKYRGDYVCTFEKNRKTLPNSSCRFFEGYNRHGDYITN
jgi:hypothetical protein